MKFLRWLVLAALALFLFPFLLRTVGLLFAVIIAAGLPFVIIAISNLFARERALDQVENFNRSRHTRVSNNLRTEFAEDESFTEEELRGFKDHRH